MNIIALQGMPFFAPGMSVADAVADAALGQHLTIAGGDVIVIAQKIVSKAEGAQVRLGDVEAGADARRLAAQTARPAELMQLMLNESDELMRVTPYVVVTRHRTGHVAANAGIDASNVEGGDTDMVLLWPRDPDASARAIRHRLRERLGMAPAIIIADSLGRAWRLGTVGTAIGCAGVKVLDDRCGEADLFGRTLRATLVAVADSDRRRSRAGDGRGR